MLKDITAVIYFTAKLDDYKLKDSLTIDVRVCNDRAAKEGASLSLLLYHLISQAWATASASTLECSMGRSRYVSVFNLHLFKLLYFMYDSPLRGPITWLVAILTPLFFVSHTHTHTHTHPYWLHRVWIYQCGLGSIRLINTCPSQKTP